MRGGEPAVNATLSMRSDCDTPADWDEDTAANDDGETFGDERPLQHARTATGVPDDGRLTELILRIERRDARALASLYELTGARIYGFVQRFMRNHALTEEVVEDTFWQVWRQAPRFDGARGRATSWLLAMARSRAIDALRREQRFATDAATGADEARVDESAQDLLEVARGTSRLHAALAALEPRGRQLLALAFFRGLTHEEIAAHTTMPLGSVKSVIRRALRQLREQLEAAADPLLAGESR